MKKLILVLVSFAFLVAACDKITGPYKEITEEQTISVDTPDFPVLNNVIQKMLMEEFTGHTCVNCPEGHKIANEMLAEMGDSLVVVSIHAGNMAEPDTEKEDCSHGFSADYRTTAGNTYNTNFGFSAYPTAMINRTKVNNSYPLSRSDWKTTANAIARTAPTMGIQIQPVFNTNGDSVFVFIKTSLLAANTRNIRLVAYLLESKIISAQLNNNSSIGNRPAICDYEHNHMLRTNISPILGTNLTLTEQGQSAISIYSLRLNPIWVKENCHVVAFVVDADTEEVLQVEEVVLK